MNTTLQQTLSSLSEELGITIDLNSPETEQIVQGLIHKYATCKLWLGILLLIGGIILAIVMFYIIARAFKIDKDKKQTDAQSNYMACITTMTLLGIVLGIGVAIYGVYNIFTYATFPEKFFINALTQYLSGKDIF